MRLSARAVAAMGAVGLALGNVGRIPIGTAGGRNTPLVVADLVVALVWLFLFAALLSGSTRLLVDRVSSAAMAFVAVALVSTIGAISRYGLGGGEALGVVAFLVRWVAYFGWYPFVAWCLTREEAAGAWRDVERAILVIAGFGIVQSAFLPGFAQILHDSSALPAWDVQGRRLVSTLLDPNFAGIVIVVGLLARLARIAEGSRERVMPLVLLTSALLLTVSRSSIAALIVGLVVLVAARGLHRRLVGLVLAGAVVVLPFLSLLLSFAGGFNKLTYDASAAQRLVPWTRAIRLVAEHPWLGVGFNAVKQAQEAHGWRLIGGADVSLDGGLLFIAAMTGGIGVFLYVLLLVRVWRSARRGWRDADANSFDRAHAVASAAAAAAVVVHSLFVNSLLSPFVMQILWIMWARLAHMSAARRARYGVAMLAPLALAGCDPCAGTLSCTTPSHVELAGTIVNHSTGTPIGGARVDVLFTGTSGFSATRSATTDRDGLWSVRLDAPDGADLKATATVSAPNVSPYVVPPFPIRSTRVNGEATVVGQWVDVPYAHFQAALTHDGAPLTNADVQFVPRPGAGLIPAQMKTATDASGVFRLDIVGTEPGNVLGTLTVAHATLRRDNVFTNFPIALEYRFVLPAPRATIPIESRLLYAGDVVDRGTGQKVSGVEVDFARTGGIPITADRLSVTTSSTGFFLLKLDAVDPDQNGEVIGDLTLHPPGSAPVVFKNLHFATYDSTSIRYAGVFAYGERWAWTVELWSNDKLAPAPDVGVLFQRTSGVAIQPDTITHLTTDANGRVVLQASVHDTGVVNGELVIFPKSGPPRLIPNLHFRTNPDDALHFGGVFGFGPSLRYVGEVLTTDGAPVVGAQVTWTQTAGIPATPTTLTSTTDDHGQFSLRLIPSTDGGVIGRVVVQPPAPWPSSTRFNFESLRLDSFESGETRLAVTYRIARP